MHRHFGGHARLRDLAVQAKDWAPASELSVAEVVRPAQLFLDVQPGNSAADARGVYALAPASRRPTDRGVFRRACGGWEFAWQEAEAAWYLLGGAGCALRAVQDAPNPSLLPDGVAWEKRGSAGDWEPLLCDGEGEASPAELVVRAVGLPPRRVFVSGNEKSHALYGVYFLRPHRNGRPSYGKEVSFTKSWERGNISWGGDGDQRWMLWAQPERGDFWRASLQDDVPLPTTESLKAWEVQERLPPEGARKPSRSSWSEEARRPSEQQGPAYGGLGIGQLARPPAGLSGVGGRLGGNGVGPLGFLAGSLALSGSARRTASTTSSASDGLLERLAAARRSLASKNDAEV